MLRADRKKARSMKDRLDVGGHQTASSNDNKDLMTEESSHRLLGAGAIDGESDSIAKGSSDSLSSMRGGTAKSGKARLNRGGIPPFVLKATAIASLGGILFGYDMGVVSGALPQVTKAFDLTRGEQEAVVSFLFLGGGFGAAVGGSLCDVAGRRRAILWTDVIFGIGAAILFCASSLWHVLVGRVVVGFAVSVSGVADVAYLHEIGPPEWRGAIVSVNEACISLGFLVAYIAGFFLSTQDPDNGWRAMFGLSAIIAVLQYIGMLYMPESPVWLREKGRHREADEALQVMNVTLDDHGHYQATPMSPSSTSKKKGISQDVAADAIAEDDFDDNDPQPVATSMCSLDDSEHARNPKEVHLQSHNVRRRADASQFPNTATPPTSDMNRTAEKAPSDATSACAATTASHATAAASLESKQQSGGGGVVEISGVVMSTVPVETGEFGRGKWGFRRCWWRCRRWPVVVFSSIIRPFLRTVRTFYKQVIVATFLSIAQQFCGHPNVLNFAPEIFAQVGVSTQREALRWTLFLGFVKFLTTCVVIWKIETIGRRWLLLFGMSCIAMSLVALSMAYAGATKDEEGFTHVQPGTEYIAVAGVFGVAFGYAASFGPLSWLLTSELFPTSIRGRALGFSTIITYIAGSLVSCTFLSGQERFGPAVPFAGYAVITISSVLFAYLAIPDTGGQSAEEISDCMSSMWIWRSWRGGGRVGQTSGVSYVAEQRSYGTSDVADTKVDGEGQQTPVLV